MRELIPSKDVREYMEKKGKKLTDFERATLAYNYPGISIGERLELLKEIMDTTQDQKLAGQIRERIAYHEKCVEKFYENKKGMVYVLETYDEDYWRPADWCYFASSELAYASGKKLGECFSIAKYRIFEKEIDMEEDGHYSVSNLHSCGISGRERKLWTFHVLIANIEYAVPDENDPKREVLEYASLMLKERCYIQEFQMVCEKMNKK